MQLKFKLGRAIDNYQVISEDKNNDKTISREHLECTFFGGHVLVKDVSSHGGTVINGNEIRIGSEKKIFPNDTLTLGKSKTFVDIKSLFNKLKKETNSTDFREEFSVLVPMLEDYEKKKKGIRAVGTKNNIKLKIGLAIVALVLIVFAQEYKIYVITSVGIIGAILGYFLSTQTSNTENLEELRIEYQEKLLCPKCKRSLIGFSLSTYKKKKGCVLPNCDAQFFV